MPSLTLKNIPDTLLDALRNEAVTNRRSLNQEVLVRLERSIEVRGVDPDAFIDGLRALRRERTIRGLKDKTLRKAREGRG
jgi:plasmid stability protein